MTDEPARKQVGDPFAALDETTLAALAQLFALKRTKRTGWLRAGLAHERCESVADHAFYVTLLCLLFADESLDRATVMEMALLHDLAETVVGDLTPSDCPREEKIARERQAMIGLGGALPDGQRLLDVWERYERQDSPEARFVRAVDRCEMAWQSALYAREAKLDPTPFRASATREADPNALSGLIAAIEEFGRRYRGSP